MSIEPTSQAEELKLAVRDSLYRHQLVRENRRLTGLVRQQRAGETLP